MSSAAGIGRAAGTASFAVLEERRHPVGRQAFGISRAWEDAEPIKEVGAEFTFVNHYNEIPRL
jgi:hypothetical protein